MNIIFAILFVAFLIAMVSFAGAVAFAGFKDHQAKKWIAKQGNTVS